jgi:ribonucleoside-triphosphate reductase (thioredoxin)
MQNNFLGTEFQSFIHLSRYSRFRQEDNRRETWSETVDRYFDFFTKHLKENNNFDLSNDLRNVLTNTILNLEVMPSMRCMMTAGPALERDNIAGYNCSYLAIDRPAAFDEILYILMNGTGVGFSVERQHITKLPVVAEEFHDTDIVIPIADSKMGWAKGLKETIALLYQGSVPTWDTSKVRPAGSILKTFGGRASGPEPLLELFRFVADVFRNAAGRRLTSLECHDIVCKIAEVVVVGGVRRSALISLSNLSDDRMRHAKSGQWWEINPQRALSNNSACYTEKPDIGIFMDEWVSLYKSKSGERGIFNRESAIAQVKKNGRRKSSIGDNEIQFGTNPCSEIILRDREFCNLSEVVIRPTDNEADLAVKVMNATIIGTFQSTLTNFKYISKKWKENCDEERLLGVSLTGILDNPLTNGQNASVTEALLQKLKQVAIDTNRIWAELLGINPSVAITCVKPSGTVSQLVDSASGIHARHSPYYIRTVRADKRDPLAIMMRDMGFLVEDDVMKPTHTDVFSFPMKSPSNSICRKDMTAIQQLELWKIYQLNWCEHKPSVTISVKESEWFEVGAWVYENFKYMSGVSFLPFSDHTYRQAPYQDCSEQEYLDALEKMPKNVDWSKLSEYESVDNTTSSQELACVAGGCEII